MMETKTITSQENWVKTIMNTQSVKPVQAVCESTYVTCRNVKREREKSTDCYICHETFPTVDDLTGHMIKHNPTPYCCEICDQSFTGKEYLQLHKKYHMEAQQVAAAVMSTNTTGRQRKKRRRYKCGQCNVRVNSQYHLDIHMSKHNGDQAKKHICEICSRSFIAQQFLKSHMLTHSTVTTFNCIVCGATFTGQGYLKLHMQLHTESKKFKCSKCDETFTNKQHLKSHSKKHTKLKHFKCDVCSKLFVSNITMEKHRINHESLATGLVQCDICSRTMTAPSLRLHMLRTHCNTDQQNNDVKRPHKCNVCGRSFIVEINLNLHMRVQHPEVASQHNTGRGDTSDTSIDE